MSILRRAASTLAATIPFLLGAACEASAQYYLQPTTTTTTLTSSEALAPAWGSRPPGIYAFDGEGEVRGDPVVAIHGSMQLTFQVQNYDQAVTRPSRAIVLCRLLDRSTGEWIGPAAHVFDISRLQQGQVAFEGRFLALPSGVLYSDLTEYRCTLSFASDESPSTLETPRSTSPKWWARSSSPIVVLEGLIR